jgi:MFS family permease
MNGGGGCHLGQQETRYAFWRRAASERSPMVSSHCCCRLYLVETGFNSLPVGAIVASTLIGTALLTLWIGMIANRHSRRMLLLAASVLMTATGVAFASVTAFWPLLIIAFVGTINPTSGDASIFQPLEQTVLTQTIAPRRRTALFARYSVIGSLAGAAGVLAAAIPDITAAFYGIDRVTAIGAMFVAYGLFGVASLILFRPLTSAVEAEDEVPKAPLGESRRLVYGLAALFGMDSLGTGFLVRSLLARLMPRRQVHGAIGQPECRRPARIRFST